MYNTNLLSEQGWVSFHQLSLCYVWNVDKDSFTTSLAAVQQLLGLYINAADNTLNLVGILWHNQHGKDELNEADEILNTKCKTPWQLYQQQFSILF